MANAAFGSLDAFGATAAAAPLAAIAAPFTGMDKRDIVASNPRRHMRGAYCPNNPSSRQSTTGNVASEDVVYLLDGLGIDSGIDLGKLAKAGREYVLANYQWHIVLDAMETSLRELAQALLRAMDSNLEIEYGPERRLTAVPRRIADVSKTRARLGFQAEVNLDQGLRRLVAWWRDERQAAGAVVA